MIGAKTKAGESLINAAQQARAMVINFFPDGSVQHTLKDKLFRMAGDRRIDRVSEIIHSQTHQKFYIRWLKGPQLNNVHTRAIAVTYNVPCDDQDHDPEFGILWFDTYEDAVDHEIKMLNAMRLDGVRF